MSKDRSSVSSWFLCKDPPVAYRSLEVYTEVKQGAGVFSCGPSPQHAFKKTGFRFRWTREKPLPTEESPVLEGRELRQTSLSYPRPLLSCWLLCWFWQTLAMGSRRKSKINKGMKCERSNYFSQIHLLSICKTWLENTSVCQFQLKMSSGHKTPVCFAARLPVKRDFWEERKKKKKNSPRLKSRNNLNTEKR